MVEVRSQRGDDVEPLVALAQRAFADVERAVDAALGRPLDRLATPSWAAHHEAVVREACADPATTATVAQDTDGTILGFAAYTVHPGSEAMSTYGEITIIAVDPRARRRGVGRELLDHAVDALRARRVPVIMLATGGDEGHHPARALYEAAGFTRLATAQYWLPGAPQADADEG